MSTVRTPAAPRPKRRGWIGSDEHKRAFCRSFVDTHIPFRPEDIVWPDLDSESLARLSALPIWNEAVRTEAETALKVQTLGAFEPDRLLAEAISLQGYEEGRHAEMLRRLTLRYGIPVDAFPPPRPPRSPKWAFVSTGYGECIDSFFAFGFFAIGRRSGYFPDSFIEIFEPIMQEEARHILFIVNWAAYLRARRPLLLRPAFDVWRAWNVGAQAFDRVRGALQMSKGRGRDDVAAGTPQDGFTLGSRSAFGDFPLRSFLELCLAEKNENFVVADFGFFLLCCNYKFNFGGHRLTRN